MVRQVATRVYVMSQGKVVEEGATEAILTNPQHAYTRQLFASVPGVRASQGGSSDD